MTQFEARPTPYGFLVWLRGTLTVESMSRLHAEIQRVLKEVERPFNVVVDCRGFFPTSPQTEAIWLSNTKLLDKAGRKRSAILASRATTKHQMERHVVEMNKGGSHRVILCCHEDWDGCSCLRKAEAWAADGVEPEEETAAD